eukprot:6777311-Prymnesium_polylepis.1
MALQAHEDNGRIAPCRDTAEPPKIPHIAGRNVARDHAILACRAEGHNIHVRVVPYLCEPCGSHHPLDLALVAVSQGEVPEQEGFGLVVHALEVVLMGQVGAVEQEHIDFHDADEDEH